MSMTAKSVCYSSTSGRETLLGGRGSEFWQGTPHGKGPPTSSGNKRDAVYVAETAQPVLDDSTRKAGTEGQALPKTS